MPDDKIPVDPDLPQSNEKLEGIELRKLDAEVKLIEAKAGEYRQRFIVRWVTVAIGVIVVVAMFVVLIHLSHSSIRGYLAPSSASFMVAIVVAPILSITTVTVAMFVGAFRKFDEGDLEKAGNGVTGIASVLKSGS